MGWADDPDHHLELGMQAARTAIQCDGRDPVGYFAIGRIYMMKGEHEPSIAALERAIELNPSFSQAYHGLSMVLMLAGRLDESRTAGEEVERLSPRDPILWATTVVHAMSDVLAGDTEAALTWIRKTEQSMRTTGYWLHAVKAAALVQASNLDEARQALAVARRELPGLSLSYLRKTLPTKHPDGLAPYLDALAAAGLPEAVDA